MDGWGQLTGICTFPTGIFENYLNIYLLQLAHELVRLKYKNISKQPSYKYIMPPRWQAPQIQDTNLRVQHNSCPSSNLVLLPNVC